MSTAASALAMAPTGPMKMSPVIGNPRVVPCRTKGRPAEELVLAHVEWVPNVCCLPLGRGAWTAAIAAPNATAGVFGCGLVGTLTSRWCGEVFARFRDERVDRRLFKELGTCDKPPFPPRSDVGGVCPLAARSAMRSRLRFCRASRAAADSEYLTVRRTLAEDVSESAQGTSISWPLCVSRKRVAASKESKETKPDPLHVPSW
mmetsp:Transcript_30803/g.95143  ORF Transcript_30803/g.95143 Transcript_30803/m.95143 type:complete len:203 (-) Transcript_30803:485-1093(-)